MKAVKLSVENLKVLILTFVYDLTSEVSSKPAFEINAIEIH
ncbi:MAG: hypothetical protein V4525_02805 [Pseudomonadota bacterium]